MVVKDKKKREITVKDRWMEDEEERMEKGLGRTSHSR